MKRARLPMRGMQSTAAALAIALAFESGGVSMAFSTGNVLGHTEDRRRALRTGHTDLPAGGTARDGDPVDLGTGLYVRTHVDLALRDTVPIIFSRTYRNQDDRSRPFGV